MALTEEDYTATMARGTAAAALLADDTFTSAMEEVRQEAISDWLATAPGSVLLREEAYALARGVAALEAKLQGRADAAKLLNHDVAKRNGR